MQSVRRGTRLGDGRTGHVPPLMILSNDNASGIPYEQLDEDPMDSWVPLLFWVSPLFSVLMELREELTYAGRR